MTTSRQLLPLFLDRLMRAGTYLLREELVGDASHCLPAIEDALADLVTLGHATYKPGMGYRLAGSALVRRAAQLRLAQGTRTGMAARQHKEEYRVGVVTERDGLGLVMYELAMPLPTGPKALQMQLKQTQAVQQYWAEQAQAESNPHTPT